MGAVLEVELAEEVFSRRIQPFGLALAEVSWRMKMFTYDGVVLAALCLEEPKLVIALSFWPEQDRARCFFKGTFEVWLSAGDVPCNRVRLEVRLDAATVDELFVAAALINPRPNRQSARRAQKHFADFLALQFPDTMVTWARAHRWRDEVLATETGTPMRVG
ncbi:MAG: hypothetical protein NZ578_01595 [Candidatus Binatia bacterium]|nr:hypothetical protein [Candidatus Binatia bacterium]